MRSDRCVELTFDNQQTESDFTNALEVLCQRLDEQVNYVIEVDDQNRKAYLNLDADRDTNTISLGHICGVVTSKVLGQDRDVFCKCGSADCANAAEVL